jgi:AbiJ N-terminal domain 3
VDTPRLRELLRPLIGALKDNGSAEKLPRICAQLGLPAPELGSSKRERMFASFDAAPDTAIPEIARRFLSSFPPAASSRNEIQDLLWADAPGPPIQKKFRRELAKGLDVADLYEDASKFDGLLSSLFDIDASLVDLVFGHSLRAQIERHVFRNPGDWTPEQLFEKLGAYECSDRRFGKLLEGMASAEVRPDEVKQRRFVTLVNQFLRGCSVELRETGTSGGYPIFTIACLGTASAGRPKNLIFASSVKPDLRFRDAVNNDIEVVTNADRVLIYDHPIGIDGLRWAELQAWWAQKHGVSDDTKAKDSLYLRLQGCLPSSSPPQKFIFRTFFEAFGKAVPRLPALLPEVWLHWDPKTVAERGVDALARFRMDFLLLLPHGVRVVIEVDGQHHYADETGRANPWRYAEMVAADRDLRLGGYEVYRFGATDLDGGETAKNGVKDFFERLFKRHGVKADLG